MRQLTNVQSVEAFHGVEKRVYLTLPGSVHLFTQEVIKDMSRLVWEAEFGGGLAQSVPLDLTLVASLGYQKDLRTNAGLQGAQLAVEVTVAGNTFRPYVGVVRGYDLSNASQITLHAIDQLYDTNPLIPAAAIVDSFPTPHLEHLLDGQHAFYGDASSRDMYFAAVTSDGALVLGPTNISSGRHAAIKAAAVTQTELRRAIRYFRETNSDMYVAGSGAWNQQSGSDNTLRINDVGFLLRSAPAGGILFSGLAINPSPELLHSTQVFLAGNIDPASYSVSPFGFSINPGAGATRSAQCVLSFDSLVKNIAAVVVQGDATLGPIIAGSLSVSAASTDYTATSFGWNGGIVFLTTSQFAFGTSPNFTITATWSEGNGGGIYFAVFPEYIVGAQAYRKFCIHVSPFSYGAAHNIAISTNPLAVLDHVNSFQAGVPYRQDQSSAMQVLVGSYQFNGYVGPERIPFTDFLDNIGQLTATTIWAGDSGTINMKTYTLSAVAAQSVNFTIPAALMETFALTEAPVGSSRFESEKANKITVNYAYLHHTGEYQQSLRAVYSLGGVAKEKTFETPYVIDTLTASLYANNLRLKYATAKEIATVGLPLQYLGVELADVLKLQHPLIVGSEGLYSVKRVELDLMNWNLSVDAVRLVS